MRLPHPPLLVISDRRQALHPLEEVAAAVFAGGCRWFSLREKDLPPAERRAVLAAILAQGRRWRAIVTVHEDIEAAAAIGADGVHLPGGGDPRVARARLPGALIGASAHDAREAAALLRAGADYVTVSPVFATASKPGYGPALGPEGLAGIVAAAHGPVLALGGVTAQNAVLCLGAGAHGIGVMGEVMRAGDPRAIVAALIGALSPAAGAQLRACNSPHRLIEGQEKGGNWGMGSINSSVDLRHEGAITVVIVDNPPVNALKHEVRAGLAEALRQAREDASVEAVVVACAGRTFFAGADITEFGKPPQAPSLSEVIAAIEAMPKPVVAALHGTALGGGFELALACHFRVAVAGARVGLPEVKLGLLPGAGGTQRLPRLVGPEKALKMIVTGEPITAAEALSDGIVDQIAEGDLTAAAIAFARRVVAEGQPLRRLRDRDDKLAAEGFADAAAELTRRLRGRDAPAACVEAVRNAIVLPFDEGLRRESELFQKLVAGDQSKAQRHVFFAEREAAQVPGMPEGTMPRAIASAAVVGAGTMGAGIAMCFANAGIPVTLVETGSDLLRQGLDRIAANYRATAARGALRPGEMERRIALIAGAVGLDAVGSADVVIEAVFEEMDLKKRVFADLDRVAKAGALLATNTSTLDVDEIARATSRPQDVVGTHFFSPANVMRLLEIVRGAASAPDAVATAQALARRLGKVPAVVGVCYGFVGNRMLARRSVEAERLLLEGALPHEVEAALVEFGLPMGPFAMMDLAGLDVGWRIRQGRGEHAAIEDALCEAGHFGQKTGKGYFRYETGSRRPIPDAEVERIILDASARAGLIRRPIAPGEIVERLVLPMINEGARILEEGIAERPGDIDVIWVYGYGWPVWRGGPMYYADRLGLAQMRERLDHYAERSGDETLRPAALIRRLAAEGRGFDTLRV